MSYMHLRFILVHSDVLISSLNIIITYFCSESVTRLCTTGHPNTLQVIIAPSIPNGGFLFWSGYFFNHTILLFKHYNIPCARNMLQTPDKIS